MNELASTADGISLLKSAVITAPVRSRSTRTIPARIAASDTKLSYTSFEAFPMSAADIAKALEAFPEVQNVADDFLRNWAAGARRFALGGIAVEVIFGDARDTLPLWQGRADAWYLDGFSPAKNPEMWSDDLMAAVARHTVPGGSFATYTAAGAVRRALSDAGFMVKRQPGFGRKRHMTTGTLLIGSPAHEWRP